MQVCCAPVAAVVLAGHRLRVSISSSDFPRMWPTADGGDFSVVVGGPLASRIALPRPVAPENRQGWDDDGGEDWTDRVPRPASATTPAWSVSSSAALRQIREVPGPIMETDVETHSEVSTPRGATLLVNERFRAAASALLTRKMPEFSAMSGLLSSWLTGPRLAWPSSRLSARGRPRPRRRSP